MVKKWLFISVFFLWMAASIGCLLRLYALGIDSGLVYGNLLHAHSHTAMMGWVYLAATALIYDFFSGKPGYKLLFRITAAAVAGLMVAFALQGYALFSILFCSVHLLCSYVFVVKIGRETRAKKEQSIVLVRVALWLLVVSTLGIWGIGPSIALFGKGSEVFAASIQFYLHFQFNGFFYFAVWGLLFKSLDIHVQSGEFRLFLILSLVSVVLTLALPMSWSFPSGYWHVLQVSGALLQAYAVLRLLRKVRRQVKFNVLQGTEKTLLAFGAFSLLMKTLFPLFLVYPELMQLSHEIRSVTIAYIHLVMLGMITAFLVFLIIRQGAIKANSPVLRWGIVCFVLGFFSTELILFFQGMQIIFRWPAWSQAYPVLAFFSFLLPLAALCWLMAFVKPVKTLFRK